MPNDGFGYKEGVFCVYYDGKPYPVESYKNNIIMEKVYLTAELELTKKPVPGYIAELEKGSVVFTFYAPSATSIGKQMTRQAFKVEFREEIATLFALINRDKHIPVQVYGASIDLSDEKVPMINIELEGKTSGKCGFCEELAVDGCTICERPLCKNHDILAGVEFPPVVLGYCEDCLYILNLLPLSENK